jgi:hypothetical protein
VDSGRAGPFIRVLGPVAISGGTASRHGTREAQLAALLHLNPSRGPDTLCADMDPTSPWSIDTLNARLGGLRSLGQDENGHPYVPRRAIKSDPYTLTDKIYCDWHRFQVPAGTFRRNSASAAESSCAASSASGLLVRELGSHSVWQPNSHPNQPVISRTCRPPL